MVLYTDAKYTIDGACKQVKRKQKEELYIKSERDNSNFLDTMRKKAWRIWNSQNIVLVGVWKWFVVGYLICLMCTFSYFYAYVESYICENFHLELFCGVCLFLSATIFRILHHFYQLVGLLHVVNIYLEAPSKVPIVTSIFPSFFKHASSLLNNSDFQYSLKISISFVLIFYLF